MKTFLVLYRCDRSAGCAASTSSTGQQHRLESWTAWFEKYGPAVVDAGAPTRGGDGTIGGYSVLNAQSDTVLDSMLADHPHRHVGDIEVLECLHAPAG